MATTLVTTLGVLTILLLLHDLVPLGRWNNVGRAPRMSLGRLLANVIPNTAVGAVPLYLAWNSTKGAGMTAGRMAIVITLSFVLVGALYSWWLPWFFGTDESRRKELAELTDGTVTFVPTRHGINPNALHSIIHLLTVAALLQTVLLIRR